MRRARCRLVSGWQQILEVDIVDWYVVHESVCTDSFFNAFCVKPIAELDRGEVLYLGLLFSADHDAEVL